MFYYNSFLGAVFVIASSVVIAVATISLFQIHTGLLSKVLPTVGSKRSKAVSEEHQDGALDTVQNFRYR